MNKITMSNIKIALIIAAIIVAVTLLTTFIVQGAQNKSYMLEEQVNVAASDIKVQEKRRVDLVYNLADCVKQYDKYESETLIAIAENRSFNGNLDNVSTLITAISETYPELNSNSNYKDLMNELSLTENLIAEYRSNYNKQVKEYNRYVRKFPVKLFLDSLGYEYQEYQYLNYEVSSDAPQNLFGD